MPLKLAIGGVALAGGAIAGSAISSNATQNASQAQLQTAQQALAQQQQQRQQAVGFAQQYAGPTPDEMTQMQTMINNQSSSINQTLSSLQKQQAQLDAADPSIKAAGAEMLNLIQGKASSVLAPLQNQLNLQRNQLVNSLASQYGSGFASTTNGMDALMKFDNQSALTIANAQQSAIANIGSFVNAGLQTTQTGTQTISQAFNSLANQGATLAGVQGGIQQRQVGSFINAVNATPVNFGQSIPFAGAPFVGQAAMGNSLANLGGQLGGGLIGAGTNSMMLNQLFPGGTGGTNISPGSLSQSSILTQPINLGTATLNPYTGSGAGSLVFGVGQ